MKVLLFTLLCIGLALSVEHCADDERVTIYETEVPGTIEYAKWDGGDTIYVLTSLNVLYRSEDQGQSFVEETSKLQRSKGGISPAVSITEVITTSTEITYLKGSVSELWITKNGGNTYAYSNMLGMMNQTIFGWFQVNPSNPNQIAVRTASRGCFYYNAGDCYFSLYVSTDAATSWAFVTAYNRFSYWGNTDKTTEQTTLFFDVSTQTSGPQTGNNYNLFKTYDYGGTSKMIMDNTAGFVIKNGGLYVAHIEAGQLTLLIGANNGDSDLRPAQMPEELIQTRYTILTTDDKFSFINVEHGVDDWGNLYVSGPDQINYALSISNNKRDPTGHVDFFPIESIRGIFLTNYYESYDPSNVEDYVKTVITYNKGGEWITLEPPRVDSQGNPITCVQCSLHLLGVHKDVDYVDDRAPWGPILSTKNAIGLIMATGNIGQYLSYDIEDANTYFSRDAGWSWVEVAKGSHVYEFADHGSLILMAKNTEETNTFMYTWNEGLNWTECRFSDPTTSFQVENIVADPDSTGLGFLVYGTKTTSSGDIGVIIWADFSAFQPRACVKPDDYEVWSPTDESRRACILGETIQVTRRKQNATCFNPDAFEIERVVARCPCAQEDYECDYCYETSEFDETMCVLSCDADLVPQDCNGYYNVSRGYRLVPGDICDYDNGLNLLPIPAKCPPSGTGRTSSGSPHKNVAAAVLAIVLTIGAAIIFIGFIIFIKKNERFRNAVLAKLPDKVKDRFGGVAFTRVGENLDDEDVEQEAKLLDDDAITFDFQKHPDDN